jgi:hypothetical protein
MLKVYVLPDIFFIRILCSIYFYRLRTAETRIICYAYPCAGACMQKVHLYINRAFTRR